MSDQTSISSTFNEQLQFDHIKQPAELLKQVKNFLTLCDKDLESSFNEGVNVRQLVKQRTQYIDAMLIALWQYFTNNAQWNTAQNKNELNGYALIAVGGYGRGELHPYSDLDLLILSDEKLTSQQESIIKQLIQLLWDCHLKVAQSVRSLSECLELAEQNIMVITNLTESRLLTGNQDLFRQLHTEISPSKMWSPEDFFDAKIYEQKERYKKFDSSSFDLEPDIKSSPGGLRDIQLLGWIAQRIFYPKNLYDLILERLITKKEYYTLMKSQLFLWRVRFALHLVTKKPEDRLRIDYQKQTANIMGFVDCENSLGVEKMMKRYYRSVLVIRNITDILLQLLEQQLNEYESSIKITPINENFQRINNRIDAINPDCFLKSPHLLLEIFHLIAEDDSFKGITASTLRAIRSSRYKITKKFREQKKNKKLFINFWHIMHTSSRALFLMKRSGILADYLIPFSQITGQMQFDMFHSYTVDEHTLFLLQNLTEFANPKLNHLFPLCNEIMQRQAYPEIIFLAGLFHDIAKGRGGDHSELGALEVKNFCHKHDIPQKHTEVIEWLVANHLLMSLTAQKRDISDPRVVKSFAELVNNQQRLELLYILTVADIRATSHSLWNSWKDTLLQKLYKNTLDHLIEDENNIDNIWLINQQEAKDSLVKKGFLVEQIEALWKHLIRAYFSKRSVESIIWQTEIILKNQSQNSTLVAINPFSAESVSEIFVYTKDRPNLFAALTASINQQGLNIHAANIVTTKNNYCYDSFFVLDDKGKPLKNSQNMTKTTQLIEYNIENIENIDKLDLSVERRLPRQFKYFSVPTEIKFCNDEYSNYTRLELTTRDQAGLLACVGKAFKLTKTKLHDARINTLGEKVEDTFIISDYNDQPIDQPEKQEQIRSEIMRQLEQ